VKLQQDDNASSQTLEKIQERLRRIERDLRSSSEDQLFIALVFPLAVLFVTLSPKDLSLFFQHYTGFPPDQATNIAQNIFRLGFAFLLASSIIRYYSAVVGKVRRSKTARVISLELMIMAWNAALFLVVVTTLLNASELLHEYTFPAAAVVTLLVFVGMVWIERKVLAFYAVRFLIFKKDVTPVASSFFAILALALYIGFLVPAALTTVIVLSPEQFVQIFVITWLATYGVSELVYLYAMRKRK